MRILTLFLALFLTLLPESAHIVASPWGQDVCLEEVTDVEEEAVICAERLTQKEVRTSSEYSFGNSRNYSLQSTPLTFVHACFVVQWLRCCRLRL